jgi:hypothetical protein
MRFLIAVALVLTIALAGQLAVVNIMMGATWDRRSVKKLIAITTAVALTLGVFRLLLQDSD